MNFFQFRDKKGLILILISSILLGIWATVHTIALRNTLLVIGSLLGVSYWVSWMKSYKFEKGGWPAIEILNWIPFLLIFSMLAWVVIHYLFFSQFPERQWKELSSTWLRSLLAAIIGSATGLALQRNQKFAWLMWLGLMISFLVLICQYLPKALARHSFFATDFFGNYIYWAKFNGVLAGIILITGLLGLSIDYVRTSIANTKVGTLQVTGEMICKKRRYSRLLFLYSFFGIFISLYSFIFIFDAKNGVGVTGFLLALWALIASVYLARAFLKHKGQYVLASWSKYFLIYLLIVAVFLGLSFVQVNTNYGWKSLVKDVAISLDTKSNTHWQNPGKMGYPTHSDGRSVAGNTYERVAWASVGIQIILDHPIGSGVLRSLPDQMKLKNIDFKSASYTHSAWIDLGLAFGWLGILLIPMCFVITFIGALMKPRTPYRALIISLSFTLPILYLVGEYGFQHGIEILLFMTAFMSALSLKSINK